MTETVAEPAIDDVPPLRGPRPDGAAPAKRKIPKLPPSMSRRTVLGGVLASATALGFSALGVFPAARKAYADGYDIYTGPCPSYAEEHNCSPGCGPSTVFADACNTGGPQAGFHRDDGVDWVLRPNECYPGGFDGWLWFYNGACGACSCHIERRCHDGLHRTDSGWIASICRWDTQCGCPPDPPPPPAPPVLPWPIVRAGDQGPDVYAIQHLLAHHLLLAPNGGVFDPATELAVRTFQTTRFIEIDGIVGPATWLSLVVPVRRGDAGNAVFAVQHQLARAGLDVGIDGRFGDAADGAVREFQRRRGLPVTGVADQNTWRELSAT